MLNMRLLVSYMRAMCVSCASNETNTEQRDELHRRHGRNSNTRQQLSREKKAALAAAVAARKVDREAKKLAAAEKKAELARDRERRVREALTAQKQRAEEGTELEAPRKPSKKVCGASDKA